MFSGSLVSPKEKYLVKLWESSTTSLPQTSSPLISTNESLTDDRCSFSSHDENLFRYHMSSTSIVQRDGAHGTSAVTAYRSCIPCTDIAKRVKMSRRLVPYGAIQHGIFFRFILSAAQLAVEFGSVTAKTTLNFMGNDERCMIRIFGSLHMVT